VEHGAREGKREPISDLEVALFAAGSAKAEASRSSVTVTVDGMASKLQEAIKQGKPFSNVRQEMWLNLQRTAAQLTHYFEHQLRPYGLSPTQYNVLRILRGAGENGLCQHEVGSRLVAQVPDVPRILARMEKAGWVRRVRGNEDRRMMLVSLTKLGAALVNDMDGAVEHMMDDAFHSIPKPDLERLNDLLVQARAHTGCGK